MDLPRRVEALERALQRLGVRFLEEELPEEAHIDGGLCTVEGEPVLFVSSSAPPWRRAEVLVDALRRLDHEEIWLPPEIRQLVQGEDLADPPVRLVASVAQMPHHIDGKEDDR